jgi:hypothetical protein
MPRDDKVGVSPDVLKKPIGLADAIDALHAEIESAIANAATKEMQFELGPIELELTFSVERTAEGHGGISFWVVDLGGSGSTTSSALHRVQLTLSALDPDGKPRRVTAKTKQFKDVRKGRDQ